MSQGDDYVRCTVAFAAPDGAVLGSQPVEVLQSRLADEKHVAWIEQDQLKRRGPSPATRARAVLLVGDLSDAQCCMELVRRGSKYSEVT